MNSTLRAGGRTPLPQRPGTSATTTPVKPVTRTVLPKDASKITPLEYKRLESQILDKSAEIQSLQIEVQSLGQQIAEITEQHQKDLQHHAERHQIETKALTDQHADEKIKFQTELEGITERMMNAGSDGGSQNQEMMELAHQQLT